MKGTAVRRVWAILRREYVQRVRNKWFLITTLGFPVLFVGIMYVSGYMASEMGSDKPLDVGVVDRAGVEMAELTDRLLEADSTLRAEAVADRDTGAATDLSALLATTNHDALLVLEPEVLEGEPATLLARASVSQRRQRSIRDAVRQAAVRAGLERAGIGADEAAAVYRSSRAGLEVRRVDQGGEQSQELLAGIALFLTFALYMMFIIYGQIITRGVLEEKTSDIVEILVSTVRPWELMLGKVLGIGAMGLTQIAIWVVTLALLAGYGIVTSAPAVAEIQVQLAGLSGPLLEMGVAFVVFFLTGYFLYASLFAAVGAIVGDQDEVQQMSFVPMMLIIVPFLLAFLAVQAGTVDSTWMTASSYFPFFTPILMVVRVTMGAAQAWEVAASVALMLVSIVGVAWVAGRIYRVGILMKGKRPTLPELVRWVRYG
jgi:ABC-2 type transport system permease protein